MAERDVAALNESQKKSTEHGLLDRVYFWIVDRYTKNGHEFTASDQFIWKGSVYVVPEIAGYMIFFAIFMFLGLKSLEKYGEGRTAIFFTLLVLWRMNIMIKHLSRLNRKL